MNKITFYKNDMSVIIQKIECALSINLNVVKLFIISLNGIHSKKKNK